MMSSIHSMNITVFRFVLLYHLTHINNIINNMILKKKFVWQLLTFTLFDERRTKAAGMVLNIIAYK